MGQDHAGRQWPGSLDQVRLYDRALTSHEVLAHVLNADQRYGLWAFEGDTQDGSGNQHHGTDLGAVTYEPGIKGQAVVFNGTTDTLDLGNSPALSQSLSNFSVMGWFKLDKDLGSEDVNHMLLSNRDGSQGGFAIQLEDGTTPSQTGRLRVTCYNGGTNESLVATGHHYFSDRDHHHVVFTFEGGMGRLYVDGLQVASKTMIEPGDSSNSLYLGSHLGSSAHWFGTMDEVTFYRRGLQAEEIQSDYLTWAPDSHRQTQPELALTGQWDFDGNYDNPLDPANPAQPSEGLVFEQGMVNQGLVLNGSATIDLGTAADVTLENGTISLWVRLDENQLGQNNGRYVLLANHDSDEGFRLIIDNDTDPAQAGSIQWTTYSTTTTTVLSSGATRWPTDETWHHLAVTKQGASAKMYLDGVLISTTENLGTPETINDPLPLSIGATGTGAPYPWKGAIDQLKIFTEPLSPYDILGTYLEGDPAFTEDASRGVQEEVRFILFASDTDPFGLQLRESYNPNHETPEPHGFTGQEIEPDFGLYYYGGRWYFPEGGRFLQVDPMREFWNSYSYVGNSPVGAIDPTGKNIFILIWKTDKGEVGHSSIAVQNYDANGKFDGTYSIFGKWPRDLANKSNFDENIPAKFESFKISGNLEDYDVFGLEKHGPNGIIEFDTTQSADINLVQALTKRSKSSSEFYNGVNSNCATFVCEVLRKQGINVSGIEEVAPGYLKTFIFPPGKSSKWFPAILSITPNQLFKDLSKVQGAKVIKDPGPLPSTRFGISNGRPEKAVQKLREN